MENIFSRKLIDNIFEIAVLVKSFFGFFEVLTGIILAISGKLIISNIIIALTQQEISEDPKDFFASHLVRIANDFSTTGGHLFAVVYLVFHGAVNIFLAVFLLKGKTWAYPVATGLFSIFLVYQIYRYFHTHSSLLLALTIFDAFIVLLVWLEYKHKLNIIKNDSKAI